MKNILALLLLIPFLNSFAQVENFSSGEFNKYVQQAVKEWDVPGLAIVVVKGDSILFEKGFGQRELGKSEPVDPETLFAAASTTKAFTAAAIGILVDEGELKWDDPVVKYLPNFKVKDPNLTKLITVRDLLTHRAGLPNTDFLWNDPNTSTDEIVQRMEHVEAVYPLRSGFIYQNIMYAVAGEVIEAVSGKPWEEFVKSEILDPLQMDRTFTTLAKTNDVGNIASPHDYSGEKLKVIENSFADPIGPAGSMWTNVRDMSKWLKFLLRGCETITGEQLLSKSTCEELFKPQTILPEPSYPTAELVNPSWNTYGLGWFQQDYEGRKVDFHTGSLSGMVAIAGLIRDEDIAVYVLGNRDHAEVRHALMYRVFDLFDKDAPRDWSRDLKVLYDRLSTDQKASQAKAKAASAKERVSNTKPTVPLESFTGIYSDPLYGKVKISMEDKNLQFKYGQTIGKLEHWHYNTFQFTEKDSDNSFQPLVNFDLNSEGKLQSLEVFSVEFQKQEEAKQ